MSAEGTFQRHIELPQFEIPDEGFLPDNVSVHVYLSPHAEAEHLQPVVPAIEEADILLPEACGWEERSIKHINAIAKGDKRALERQKLLNRGLSSEGYSNAYAAAIAKTPKDRKFKRIAFIDVPATHPEKLTIGDLNGRYKACFKDSPDATLHGLADIIASTVRVAGLRDRIMVASIGPVVTNAVDSNPRLKRADSVKVLSTLGFIHEPVLTELQKHLPQERITATRNPLNDTNNPDDVIWKTYAEGGTPTRTQMIATMLATSLSFMRTSITGPYYLYDPKYPTQPDFGHLLGKRILETMMTDPEQAARWSFETMTQKNTKTNFAILGDHLDLAVDYLEKS